MEQFKGVWPALVTPSNADHTINIDSLIALIDYLLDKGVDGFYVGGSTGEGVLMPVNQRKQLAEIVLDHINSRVPVILHVGAVSVDDAIDLAIHAQDHGANGISSIIPPLYTTMNSVVAYYTELASAVPMMPFMPYILNPNFNAVELIKNLSAIENLAGSKYTGPNMYEFRQILDLGSGDWSMFSGMDEQCIYGAMMGATGAIGSTVNMMSGAYKKIHYFVKNGEFAEAQALQVRANRVTETMIRIGFSGALRFILSQLVGCPMGDPRLPHLPLSDVQKRDLEEQLTVTDLVQLTTM
jgi:N-acetylneuraminate lyase